MGVHRQILTDPSCRVQQRHPDAIKVYGIMREENRAQHCASKRALLSISAMILSIINFSSLPAS